MDTNITRQSDIKAVSFSGSSRLTIQIKLVVDLIKSSIDKNSPITKEDITSIYIDWRIAAKKGLTKQVISHYESRFNEYHGKYFDHAVWKHTEATREGFTAQWDTQYLARQWFKNNLAAAIIKGKLLVIPIIDIE